MNFMCIVSFMASSKTKLSLLLFIFTHKKYMLGGLKYQNEVFQIRNYMILKFTYTKKLHLFLVCLF